MSKSMSPSPSSASASPVDCVYMRMFAGSMPHATMLATAVIATLKSRSVRRTNVRIFDIAPPGQQPRITNPMPYAGSRLSIWVMPYATAGLMAN